MAASRPAFPSEPNLRRLGVGSGGGGGGGDRVLRAQIVIAVVMSFTILAVLLYLLRRPQGTENAPPDAGADSRQASEPAEAGGIIRTKLTPAKAPETKKPEVELGAPVRVKCSSSAQIRGNEGSLCDRLPVFEQALEKAILASHDCAPKTGSAGTLNYVLTVDFTHKVVRVFPGASGQWRGPQARRAAKCVQSAVAAPKWEAIPHQYRYYMIAILAKYPAPAPLDTPAFE